MPCTPLRPLVHLLIFAAVLFAETASAAGANALAGHPSPYLAMHGQDPVAWRDWGPAVLREARETGRPVFISSGYFACHWCHVMQRESYQDEAIAVLINEHFIPVKLDRELHPALDAYLIGFTQRTAGQAGWPLNVFLTPEGYPLIGLTYVPPSQFKAVLERTSGLWGQDAARLADLARQAAEERAAEDAQGAAKVLRPEPAAVVRALVRQALMIGDELAGGFGHQSRFPMAPNLAALLAVQAREPEPGLAEFLCVTLDAMANKGLRDHLGGGFFRYTVDPDWATPHFEKMLYDQALLIPLYLQGAEVLNRPDYRTVARETVEFMLRELAGAEGAFIASLSAVDADGVEGGSYLWRPDELERLLTPGEHRAAVLAWDLRRAPRFEAGHLLIPTGTAAQHAQALDLRPDAVQGLLASARAKLLAARGSRSLPRDDKRLAGWNGLALSALAEAAAAFDEPRYRAAAKALRDFLVERLWTGSELLRAAGGGRITAASLEDYAYVAQGVADWAAAGRSKADRDLSRRLTALAWERFHGDAGWRLDADPLLPAVPAETALPDSPLPSPSALLIALALESGDETLARRAREALARSVPTVAANPFAFAGQALLLSGQANADGPQVAPGR